MSCSEHSDSDGESLVLFTLLLASRMLDSDTLAALKQCSTALYSAIQCYQHEPEEEDKDDDRPAHKLEEDYITLGTQNDTDHFSTVRNILERSIPRKTRKRHWKVCLNLLTETSTLLFGIRPATLLDNCAALPLDTLSEFARTVSSHSGVELSVIPTATAPLLVRNYLFVEKLQASIYAVSCILALKRRKEGLQSSSNKNLWEFASVQTLANIIPCFVEVGRYNRVSVSSTE